MFQVLVAVTALLHLTQGIGYRNHEALLDLQDSIEAKAVGEGLRPVPASWLKQPIDHFSVNNTLFSQRFFVNSTLWDGKGPIFLCVGGEGPPLSGWSVVRSIHCDDMVELASSEFALLLALEHRCYGESQPYSGDLSIESLQVCTSKQALADIGSFINHVNDIMNISHESKWVTFGGSYPGMLAAWARLLFPSLVYASVSSSSPLHATIDNFGYNDIVARSLANPSVGGSRQCLDLVTSGHQHIGFLLESSSGQSTLKTDFHICETSWTKNDIAGWAGSGVVRIPSQSNDPACTSENCNIAKICSFLLSQHTNPYDALVSLALEQRRHSNVCQTISFDNEVKELSDPLNNQRTWIFQTCNEFGFYQTCNTGSSCPYTQGYNDYSTTGLDLCSKLFAMSGDEVLQNIQHTNAFYGSIHPNSSRILFPNGEIDPWHALGVLESPSKDLPTLWVPGASHHWWTHPITTITQNTVVQARKEIFKIVSAWLHSETQ